MTEGRADMHQFQSQQYQQRKKKCIVLLSGGLDSAANLALCVKNDEVVLALTCKYAQRAERREIQASKRLCDFYGVRHEVVDLSWLGSLGGSALTDIANKMPTLTEAELDDLSVTEQSARLVWVPNRNGVLINVAAAYAERLGAASIVVGFNCEEAATFADNSIAFMDCSTRALLLSTRTAVTVTSYTADLNKCEIVSRLRKLSPSFPFELVWSCYFGGEMQCGSCESCLRFARALGAGAVAGVMR